MFSNQIIFFSFSPKPSHVHLYIYVYAIAVLYRLFAAVMILRPFNALNTRSRPTLYPQITPLVSLSSPT